MKVLIIQTAFIGDVILSTALIEQVKQAKPEAEIHFVLRAGNEVLLQNNPHIHKVWVWNKKQKYKSLFGLISQLRKYQFDYCFNLQRFMNSGLMMGMIKADHKACFDKNPLSFLAHKKIEHKIPYIDDSGNILHEVDRNEKLLPKSWQNIQRLSPKMYFENDPVIENSVVLAPKSVWFTKQWPIEYWKELAVKFAGSGVRVHLIGAPSDSEDCAKIAEQSPDIINHCGKLSLYESANLMRNVKRVFANDSAALHLASAVNTPSTAIFCSTVKEFGFYGLSDDSILLEDLSLECKPCGLHGRKACPLGHFKCGYNVEVSRVFETL